MASYPRVRGPALRGHVAGDRGTVMKHKHPRSLVILAFTLFAFMLIVDRFGVGVALIVGFPFGLLMGRVARHIEQWIDGA